MFLAFIVFSSVFFVQRFSRFIWPVFQGVILTACLAVLLREGYPARLLRTLTGTPTPVTQTAHYREMQAIHVRRLQQITADSPVQIGFAGDSIIEGWLTSAHIPASINLGVGRDTIDGLLARITPQTVQQVPVWYLAIGINDVLSGHDPASLPDQITRLAARFGPAQQLIWRETLPVVRPDWSDGQEAHRQTLNTQIRTACARLPNCIFLPAPEGYSPQYGTSDGLHPNATGYAALTRQLRQLIPLQMPSS